MSDKLESHLGTSISGWGRALMLAMQSLGIDGRQVFLDCGLDPDNQGLAYIRNPVSKMQYVWQIAESNVDDTGVLVGKIVEYLNPSSFYALGFGLYASQSIEEMFNRVCTYREVLSSSVNMSTRKTKNEFEFIITDLRPVKSYTTSDVTILFLLKICRELCGPDFSPDSVHVPWNEQRDTGSFKNLLNAPLIHDTKNYILSFRTSDVEKTLPGANAQLASYQDKLCRDYLYSLDEHKHLPLRVKLKILQTLNSGDFSINFVASSMHMSARTLQRKLKQEKTGFRELVEEAKKELAEEYILNPGLSATQITYRLGFSDLSSFSNSFKLWFGLSFSEYRTKYLQT